jgi:hypothetical protein
MNEDAIYEKMFGRRAGSPPQRSVSETWSWNSNDPNNIRYNRTETVSWVESCRLLTPAESLAESRRWNEWVQQQMQLTRRQPQPAQRPSFIGRILRALTA